MNPRTLALTVTADSDNLVVNDVHLENGRLHFLTGREAMRQKIMTCLSSFVDEWFLSPLEGMPYLTVAIEKGVGASTISSLFRRALKRIDGVQQVISVITELDRQTRVASVRWVVLLDGGDTLSGTFTPFEVP